MGNTRFLTSTRSSPSIPATTSTPPHLPQADPATLKMKLSFVTAIFLAIVGVTAAPVVKRTYVPRTGGTGTVQMRGGTFVSVPRAATSPPAGGNLPGLNSVQTAHARAIIGEVQSAGVGKQGCLAAFATALVESSVYEYANNAVPSSLNYPHDKIGSDHDSIGIFQQRASIYTNIAADMDPAQSAGLFFQGMTAISGWQTMDVGTLCQKVQKSAYPTRYSAKVSAATSICSAAGIS